MAENNQTHHVLDKYSKPDANYYRLNPNRYKGHIDTLRKIIYEQGIPALWYVILRLSIIMLLIFK